MAKGQKRSNREVRKPKQNKQPVPAPVALKGLLSTSANAQKKKG
ncbi:MAG: hypothetical protein RIM84_26985 [Alphaproteobacteria bacterium]